MKPSPEIGSEAPVAYRLAATVRPEDYDAAMGMLFVNGAGGCEEFEQELSVRLIGYFDNHQDARRAEFALMSLYLLSPVMVMGVALQDWNARWRETMEPACLSETIWVSPEWLPPPLREGDYWIKIEPKMAFGTGHHETTRLAAQALIGRGPLAGKTLLDIGAGSGVLCFVADHIGARMSVGLEIDPDCLENLAENYALNPIQHTVRFLIGTVDALGQHAAFDAIIMNMIRTHSEPLLERCHSLLTANGTLIWSGLLGIESAAAIARAKLHGFACKASLEENEWWCGVFARL